MATSQNKLEGHSACLARQARVSVRRSLAHVSPYPRQNFLAVPRGVADTLAADDG